MKKELSIKELCKIIVRHGGIISLVTFLVLSAASFYYFEMLPDEFTASTTLYVLNQQNEETISISDLSSSLALVADYREIITSKKVRDAVAESLGMPTISTNRIAVGARSDTRIIEILVTGPDAYVTANVANGLAREFSKVIVDIMRVDNVAIIDVASVPTFPSGPARERQIIIVSLAAAVVTMLVIILKEIMNTTLKVAADVEQQLELPVFAEIPYSQTSTNGKSRKTGNKIWRSANG